MSPAGTKVVGYVRVSTSQQVEAGGGLGAQRAAIEAEATRKGWILVTIFEDKGVSGKSVKGRKALDAALALIEAGGADALVTPKLDRLSRSIVDFGTLVERAKANKWAIVLLDMQLDMTTPQGELMANMLVSFAQFERRLIGERTKDGLAARRAEGVVLGRPRSLPTKVVARIVREREAGISFAKIAAGLNSDAIPTGHGGYEWYASSVRAIATRKS